MIKRLKVRNFRSIADLDLTFDPVTVLVGRSGVGKSNVVHCIRFLRNLTIDPPKAIVREGGWVHTSPAGTQGSVCSIELTFSIPGEEDEFCYHVAFGPHPGQPSGPVILRAETLTLGRLILFSRKREGREVWAWEQPPAIAAAPAQLDGPMLGSFPSLQKIAIAYAALSSGIGCYHFTASVLTDEANNGPQNNTPGLWDNAGNFKEAMRAIAQNLHHPAVRRGILASLKKVNASIASVDIDSLTDPRRAVVGHDAGGKIFELALEQESDGLRRFYAHLLALYQTPPKLTNVFEEPENGIFPGALALLAQEFKAAAQEQRGQVIITTHSPGLLDQFDVDAIRVVDMQDGRTTVGWLASEQRQAIQEHLMTTGELLTVDFPRIETSAGAEQSV